MSSCSYCHHRKGKRPCPALGGLICSLCCGEHRLTRISCPTDCPYLDTGNDYQQKRLGAQFAPVRRDFYQKLDQLGGHKAVALFNLIEVITFGYFEGRRDGQDVEVVTALQALRRALSPLHVPAGPCTGVCRAPQKRVRDVSETESRTNCRCLRRFGNPGSRRAICLHMLRE